ncbi:MAG: hypothetical protein VKS61_09985 [Candidatus Sericytochromatia bacterium]|nr:hypothetical protein [Candidatus Sericytochromatia bacterium]
MADSQPPASDDASFSSQLLGEFLLEQGLVTAEQLAEAHRVLVQAPRPEALSVGPAFVPSHDGRQLHVYDAMKGTRYAHVALTPGEVGDGAEQPTGWAAYGDGRLLVADPTDISPRRWVAIGEAPRLGLVTSPGGAFLYTGVPPRGATSPRLHALPSPWLNPPGASGPLDLFVSARCELLVAANRGAGTVHLVSVESLEQRGAVALRPAGHDRGMGVAISHDMRTAYLSDGLTPRLGILDLATLKLRHQLFPTGPLGSLMIGPDGHTLLACFSKGPREMGVLSISLPDLRVKHLLNLPGKGEGERPGLPLVPALDGESAFLVTYSFETREPHHVLQLDVARQRVVRSHALREMPLTVALPAPPTWCPDAPDVGTVLLSFGLISDDDLRTAREHLAGGGESQLSLQTVPIAPEVLARLPERLIRDRGVIPLNEIDGHLVVAMGNATDPRARQFVLDLAAGLPVRVLPMTPTEFELFMAERYPALLERHLAQAGGGLTQPSGPAELTTVVPQAPAPEPPAVPTAQVPSAADRSVARGAAAAKPTPVARPLAADDWGDLPGNRFLLINPLKRQVAELDRTGRSTWLYSPEGDTLTRRFSGFVHAARLADGHTLVVDLGANRVLEVNPAREVVWHTHEDAKLKSPRHAVRLPTGSTLVVDAGNNRLVEIDAQGRPAWTYGEMGCTGSGLFKPAHVSVLGNGRLLVTDAGNHRVVEVDPAKGVVWQYGNVGNRLGGGQGVGPNQLQEPSAAERLASGHTLVVDAGNHRVVEVDSLGSVVWTYRVGGVTEGQGVRDPILARRLASGNTLVAGRQGMCEVTPDLVLVWEYHLLPPTTTSKATTTRPMAEVAPVATVPEHASAESDVPPNLPATFLQADRTGHRLWEVDRAREIVWQYTGLGQAGSDVGRLDRPHHVRRLRSGNNLVTDSGHHRVIELSPEGRIVWSFGEPGKLGAGAHQLANPRSAERLTNGNTLIADQSNKRVIEVSPAGEIVWRFEGAAQRLQAPTHATKLVNGHLLVVDWGAHMVYEVSTDGRVVWSHGELGRASDDPRCLFHPEHAMRLPDGNTLIADTQNHRVLEVSPAGEIVWQYGGVPASYPRVGRFGLHLMTPIAAWRLPAGQTVVQHAGKGHVVEVEPDLSIAYQFAPTAVGAKG